jgi:hypothetical protein
LLQEYTWSSLIPLLQSVVCGFLLEFNLDISVGKILVGNLNGFNALLKEVLLSLVQDNLREWRSVKANSSPGANDDTGEEELVKDGSVNSGKSPAVGSGLSSVLLDPAGLDAAVGEDKDGLLKTLLELGDEFFIDGGKKEFVASVVDVDKDERLVLLEGVLGCLGDIDTGSQLLALGIKVAQGLNKSTSNLLLKMGKSLRSMKMYCGFASTGFLEYVSCFSGFGHLGNKWLGIFN